jgi:hypothetical protein
MKLLFLVFALFCLFFAAESKAAVQKELFVQRFAKCVSANCKKFKGQERFNCRHSCYSKVKLRVCLYECSKNKTKESRLTCRKDCFEDSKNKKTSTRRASNFLKSLKIRRLFLNQNHEILLKKLKKTSKRVKKQKKECWRKCHNQFQDCRRSRITCSKKFYKCAHTCHAMGRFNLFAPLAKYITVLKKKMEYLRLHPNYRKKLIQKLKNMKRTVFIKKCFKKNGKAKCCVFVKTYEHGKRTNTKATCTQ